MKKASFAVMRVESLVLMAVASALACSSTPTSTTDGGNGEASIYPPGGGCSEGGRAGSGCTCSFDVDMTSCKPQEREVRHHCPSNPLGWGARCAATIVVPCGVTGALKDAAADADLDAGASDGATLDGEAGAVDCRSLCDQAGWPDAGCSVIDSTTISCGGPCGAGRLPEGCTLDPVAEGESVARHLAAMAQLEAASVHAFETMERELRALGAPADLLARIERARRDEIRHARAVARAAKARGAKIPRVRNPRRVERDVEAIATENAREGCARETLGVAVLMLAAARAEEHRALFASLAEDEMEHARLSWDVAAWLEGLLDEDARARVALARADELRRCARSPEPPREVARVLGWPTSPEIAAMASLEG